METVYPSVKSHPTPTPCFAGKNDPPDRAETGGAEPPIAEQSRSWRAAMVSGDYARFLKRQLSLPVSTMSQW